MDNLTIENDLKELIARILEIEPSGIGSHHRFVEDLGADSMRLLEFMVAVEKRFKVEIPEEYLNRMITLNDVKELVVELLGGATQKK